MYCPICDSDRCKRRKVLSVCVAKSNYEIVCPQRSPNSRVETRLGVRFKKYAYFILVGQLSINRCNEVINKSNAFVAQLARA